jgi:DNA-binding CsgD family transcriptional regulator
VSGGPGVRVSGGPGVRVSGGPGVWGSTVRGSGVWGSGVWGSGLGVRSGGPAADQGRRPAFGPGALTAHERRLVAMAVAGQTNSAIARSFGVSRRAVEFHFTHIYRKLGITRRPQLHRFAAALAA